MKIISNLKKRNKHIEIDFKLLSEIIGHKALLEPEETSEHFKKYHEYYSPTSIDSVQWDYDAYIRRIRALIEDHNISEHFHFDLLKSPEIIPENGQEYFVKYKITIKNLKLLCGVEPIVFDQLVINESYPSNSRLSKHQYKGGVYIEFANCNFVQSKKYAGNPYINLDLGSDCRVNFRNCVFENVDLYVAATKDNCFLSFVKSIFKNRHITIGGGIDIDIKESVLGSDGFHIKSEIQTKLQKLGRLEERLNEEKFHNKVYQIENEIIELLENGKQIPEELFVKYKINSNKKIRLNTDDIEFSKDKTVIISFRDNEINEINFWGKKFFFLGENKINKIISQENPLGIYYSPYTKLDTTGQYARHHKPIFIMWKKIVRENGDNTQELIFNRELLKCEKQILKEESKSFGLIKNKTYKDRFVLWFNNISSEYGLNWIRPVLLVLFVNFGFSCLYFILNSSMDLSLSKIIDTVGSFIGFNSPAYITSETILNSIGKSFELLLPTNSIAKVTGNTGINRIWEAGNILKNILNAALIYQALIAFRKFKNK